MKLNLLITYKDETEKTVEATARDFVAFEEKFDMSITRLEKEAKLTHFFFMAWNVEKRSKSTALGFDEWLDTIESVEVVNTKK